MEFPKVVFEITGDNNCPFYALGDRFTLSGKALVVSERTQPRFIATSMIEIPPGKPECPILYGDLTNVLIKYNGVDKISSYVLQCSGCSGTIRLEYARQQQARPPESREEDPMDGIVRQLQRFSMFRTLDTHNIRAIMGYLDIREYPEGETVIARGEHCRRLYILVAGTAEVAGGGDTVIASLGPGEVFGEMSLLTGDPASASVVARTRVKTLSIDGGDFRRILHKYPSLQMYFAQLLTRRLSQSNLERGREGRSAMIGKLSELPQADLYQMLKSGRKTGLLTLTLSGGPAKLHFRDGEVIRAHYAGKTGVDAFFETLMDEEGRFRFTSGLAKEDADLPEIGNLMWLLMEGLRRVDERRAKG